MAFIKKNWIGKGKPNATPLSESAMNDLESRISKGIDEDTGWICLNEDWAIYYRKKGNIVEISALPRKKSFKGYTQNVVAQLPVGCRPSRDIVMPAYCNSSSKIFFGVNENGAILFFNWDVEATYENVSAHITFII